MNAAHFCLLPKNQETSFERCLSKIKQLAQTTGHHYLECDNLTYGDYLEVKQHAIMHTHETKYIVRMVVNGSKEQT